MNHALSNLDHRHTSLPVVDRDSPIILNNSWVGFPTERLFRRYHAANEQREWTKRYVETQSCETNYTASQKPILVEDDELIILKGVGCQLKTNEVVSVEFGEGYFLLSSLLID